MYRLRQKYIEQNACYQRLKLLWYSPIHVMIRKWLQMRKSLFSVGLVYGLSHICHLVNFLNNCLGTCSTVPTDRTFSLCISGVRGVFDGVIENMHLHWKHREVVKLISKQKTLSFVQETARLLEYESGGILVAIERVPKGYALIFYRGKNYRRPINIRPRNLLTKAKALKRAVAMQRHEVSWPWKIELFFFSLKTLLHNTSILMFSLN